MQIIGVLGLLVAIYLTLYHYAGIPLVCSEQGVINCNSVLNSSYAILFGVPIAVYGVIFFMVELAVIHLAGKKKDWVVLYNTLGLGFVAYLLYAEYMLGEICIYCTAIHIITLALFILSFFENERMVL